MGDGIVRVRAPHNVHILSWVLSLEKTGTVSCHFKKCKFMAMTVEEMANHYIYCKCDNVDLPHECDVCKQKTDCLMKLLYHKIYSHSYNATSEELRNLSGFLSCKREITTPLRRAWKIFLDNKGYLICLKKTCAYVLESIEEMEEHFLHECKEDFWNKLTLACEKCNGRFYNQHKLKAHFSVVHNQSQRKGRIVKPVVSDETLLKEWATAIINHKQAKCPVEQCKFVCNSISTLAKHYKYCNGERKYSVSCPICHCWVVNEDKLTEHRKVIHKDTEPFICKPEIDDKSWILESNPLEDDEEAKYCDFIINHEEESNKMRGTCEDYDEREIKDEIKTEPPDIEEINPETASPYFEETDPLSLSGMQDFEKTTKEFLNGRYSTECFHSSRIPQATGLSSAPKFNNVPNNKKSSSSSVLDINKPIKIEEPSSEPSDLITDKQAIKQKLCDPVLEDNCPKIHKRFLCYDVSDSRQTLLPRPKRRYEIQNPKTNGNTKLYREPYYKHRYHYLKRKCDAKHLKLINIKDECNAFGNQVAVTLRNMNSYEKRKQLKLKIQEAIMSFCQNMDSDED